MSTRAHLVGVDVGGTTTDAVVASAEGRPAARVSLPTDPRGGAAVTASTIDAIEAAVAEARVSVGEVGAIGLGVPGQVEPETGVVRTANNLAIDGAGYPIAAEISVRFGVPTAVENDVRAAALGLYAADPEPPDILTYLSVGTGISAGTVVAGRLLRGTSGVAGELGQLPVVAGVAAGAALTSTESAGAGPAVEAAAMLEGIERDAIFATAGGKNILRVIADVVLTIFAAYDPAILYVGGGVSSARGFHPALVEAVDALRSRPELTFDFVDLTRISPVPAGVHPGTSGAIHLARQAMEDPGRRVRPAKQEATA